jgi:hypothetical protein
LTPRPSARACAAAALLWCVGPAFAQGQVFADDPKSWFTPQGVANVFQQACLRTGAQAEAAVDWALTQGFEPLDALGGTGYDLLEGQPGNVLRAPPDLSLRARPPETGVPMPGAEDRLLLVVTHDQRCTVWAQRVSGPQLRMAMAEVLDRLGTSGARVTRDFERNIERGGAWRNQSQWRYRALRGSVEFGVSAVTTLNAAPATQALNMAPWQALLAPPGPAPAGVPGR